MTFRLTHLLPQDSTVLAMKQLSEEKIRQRLQLEGNSISEARRRAADNVTPDPNSKHSNRHYSVAARALPQDPASVEQRREEDRIYKELKQWVFNIVSAFGNHFDFKGEVLRKNSNHAYWQTTLKFVAGFAEMPDFARRRLLDNTHASHLRTTLAIHNLVDGAARRRRSRIKRAQNNWVDPNNSVHWKEPYPRDVAFQVFAVRPEEINGNRPLVSCPTLPLRVFLPNRL